MSGSAVALVVYLWLLGMAAGVYLVAALVEWFGDDDDRRAVRSAHRLAFPLACLGGVLAAIAGSGPNPAWRLPPGSAGAWVLGAFVAFSFVTFLGEWRPRLRHGRTGRAVALGGAAAAVVLAGRAGVSTGATNRPIWSDPTWIGPLLLASAVSMGVAVLVPAARRLARLGVWAISLELISLVLLIVALGPLAGPALLRWPGVLIPAVVVPFGVLSSLLMMMRRGSNRWGRRLAAALAVAAGLVLRAALVVTPGALLVGRP